MKSVGRFLLSISCVAVALSATPTLQSAARPLSIDNRLLLNRLALKGERDVEVMLACDPQRINQVVTGIERIGGTIRRANPAVGYLRALIKIEDFATLVNDSPIEAFEIASMAQDGWNRNSPPRREAESLRAALNNRPLLPAVNAVAAHAEQLPDLSPMAARGAGYTGDDGTGIEEWLRQHPTFDGRGVTIAFIESAQPELSLLTMQSAKALDGRDIPKVAGILNAVDPAAFDETRVTLTSELNATSTWIQLEGRTFVLPHVGTYLFGTFSVAAGNNLIQQFGVLRSLTTDEIWVDTDGDADFRNEQPVHGVVGQSEVRSLKLTTPRKADLDILVIKGSEPESLNVYPAQRSHQSMTVSVAAGNRTTDSLAFGVAPAARVLLVRHMARDARFADFIEAYLTAAARPDVDVLTDSMALNLLSATEHDFVGVIFRRIVDTYHKPIFHSAGNHARRMLTSSPLGGAYSVGGVMSPATFAALFGGGQLSSMLVHPVSSAGPGIDGAMAPDFLAPSERLAADLCTKGGGGLTPRNRPVSKLPPCYQVSGGTSSTSPFAAGVAALLISAAKQTGVDHSVAHLDRALRSGAKFLLHEAAYEQGSGVLNVQDAWQQLQLPIENARITVSAESDHPLMSYAAAGSIGPGLLETNGWVVGMTGSRMFSVRRDSGPAAPTTYQLTWTGNDGTFTAPSSIVLPLNKTIAVPVTISPRTAGAHSALLNVHEPERNAIVQRSLATVIVPARLDAFDHRARFVGTLPLLGAKGHFWSVPPGTAALSLALTVTHGAVEIGIGSSDAMASPHFEHKYPPSLERTLPPGTYHFIIPDPSPGMWTLEVRNDSAWRETDPTLVSVQEAQYTFSVSALAATLQEKLTRQHESLVVTNTGADLVEPAVAVSHAVATTYQDAFRSNGLANQLEIQVPTGASALVVNAQTDAATRRTSAAGRGLDLYLYDCTAGECFLHDAAVLAPAQQRLVVRRPRPGRWVAMVNGAPSFPVVGAFVANVSIVLEHGSRIVNLGPPLGHGEKRTVDVNADADVSEDSVQVYELFDRAFEHMDKSEWVRAPMRQRLTTNPAAIAMAFSRRSVPKSAIPSQP